MRYFRTSAAISVRLLRGCPRLVVPAFIAIGALVAVPSFGTHSAQAQGAGLKIHATDFSYATNGATASPGPVHVEFFNDSTTYEHEVLIFKADQQAKLDEFLAAKRAGKDVEESEFFTVAAAAEDVPAGTSVGFDANLPEGEYVMACFISSPIAGQDTIHYDLGMHTGLTVSASAAAAPAAAPVQVSAPAPAAAAAAAQVQAPNTGTGPSDGGTNYVWVAAIAAVGALLLASGGLVRRASRRR